MATAAMQGFRESSSRLLAAFGPRLRFQRFTRSVDKMKRTEEWLPQGEVVKAYCSEPYSKMVRQADGMFERREVMDVEMAPFLPFSGLSPLWRVEIGGAWVSLGDDVYSPDATTYLVELNRGS